MKNLDYRSLRQAGRQALKGAQYSPKKLILWHTGVTLAVGFLLSLIHYLLDQQIGDTGGLEGLGSRTYLETAQTILTMMQPLLLPFWSIGLAGAMLRLARGEYAGPESLLEGFRHWGAVLRTNLLRGLVYMAVVLIAMQVGSMLFTFSPAAGTLFDLAEQIQNAADPNALLTQEVLTDLALKMLPYMLIPAVILLIPVAYRLRMMDYVIMDRPKLGAVFALRMSLILTRRKCLRLFRIDLRFWWFYVLEVLAVALCYGDILLPLAGVSLPGDAAVMGIGFYAVGILAQLGLYVWKKDEISATYVCAYEALLPPAPAPPARENDA